MTREEFVKKYAGSHPHDEYGLTASGGGYKRVAVSCSCGDELCWGWEMINPVALAEKLEFEREICATYHKDCDTD